MFEHPINEKRLRAKNVTQLVKTLACHELVLRLDPQHSINLA